MEANQGQALLKQGQRAAAAGSIRNGESPTKPTFSCIEERLQKHNEGAYHAKSRIQNILIRLRGHTPENINKLEKPAEPHNSNFLNQLAMGSESLELTLSEIHSALNELENIVGC